MYRKYRPQNFASVVGQKPAVSVITSSLEKHRPGHAYLFSGSRGCGKTSVARIFAKALNCTNPQGVEPCGECMNCKAVTEGESLDVIEIDGASNNSVDQIRELKANVTLAPFSSRYKIYIIDEVHMLTVAAFNALLKTLEEPPEHVIFIMATTEPQKVPVTIRSRCQHIPFHSIGTQDIYNRLEEICRLENVRAESEALWEISRQADGALRDALSLLEQVIASGDITLANVESTFGAGSRSTFERWIKTYRTDKESAYMILKTMFDSGASGIRVFEELFSLVNNLWLVSRWKNVDDSLGISEQEKTFLHEEASNWKTEDLHSMLIIIMKILTQARTGVRPAILLGIFMINLEDPAYTPVPSAQTSQARPVSFTAGMFTRHEEASPPAPAVRVNNDDMKPSENVPVDFALKDELLKTALEKNQIVILSGLFDSRPYIQDGNLILDFGHRYTYEVFRLEQRAAEFPKLFTGYKGVVLRYGTITETCQAVAAKSDSYMTEEVSPEPVPEVANVVSHEEPRVKQDKPKGSDSVFEKIKLGLLNCGVKSEIVLIKSKRTNEESDSETESASASESDSESETENERESGGE